MSKKKNGIVENNFKIALYMKGKFIAEYNGEAGGYFNSRIIDFEKKERYPDNNRYVSDLNLKYNSDYNWLMPVVEKLSIESIDFMTGYRNLLHTGKVNITTLWELVIETINKEEF